MQYFRGLDKEYSDKNYKILNFFGEDHQYKKLVEEMRELTAALQEFSEKNSEGNIYDTFIKDFYQGQESEDLLSELADCIVLSSQLNEIDLVDMYVSSLFKYHHVMWINSLSWEQKYKDFENILIYKINEIIKYKIDRTIERYQIPLGDDKNT